MAPLLPRVVHGERPAVTGLVDLRRRAAPVGVALLSAERVRLLCFAEAELEVLEECELSILSLAWRERKAQSTRDPARGQGVSSSGHDQYDGRLENNRRRFLAECGQLMRERLRERELEDVVVFGPLPDVEAFRSGLDSTVRAEVGGDADLISAPTKEVSEAASAAIERLAAAREREVVERTLEQVRGGSRGAAGLQETQEALRERRVEHVAFDPAIGDAAEALVRGAFAGDAKITIVHDGVAELLQPAEGVAAILRY